MGFCLKHHATLALMRDKDTHILCLYQFFIITLHKI